MYYKLYCETPEDEDGGYAEINDFLIAGVENWITGLPLNFDINEEVEFEIQPEEGYRGPVIEMYRGQVILMSERLVKGIRSAGVDNLETYPVRLRNAETDETHKYRAINIVGIVAAADLEKSSWENYDGEAKVDTFFDKLVVDPTKCNGLLMFRLAESLGTIIVHEQVRMQIESSGIDTMTFLSST